MPPCAVRAIVSSTSRSSIGVALARLSRMSGVLAVRNLVHDRVRLMADTGIVRNGAKIDATVGNAAALLAASAAFGSFDRYLTSIVPRPPAPLPSTALSGGIPATTPVSDALSKDLKARSFRFVGSTIVYAFMQSVGLVDDHVPGCFRYRG